MFFSKLAEIKKFLAGNSLMDKIFKISASKFARIIIENI